MKSTSCHVVFLLGDDHCCCASNLSPMVPYMPPRIPLLSLVDHCQYDIHSPLEQTGARPAKYGQGPDRNTRDSNLRSLLLRGAPPQCLIYLRSCNAIRRRRLAAETHNRWKLGSQQRYGISFLRRSRSRPRARFRVSRFYRQ